MTDPTPRMGRIGEPQREYEFEPLEAPAVPEAVPANPDPDREPVQA